MPNTEADPLAVTETRVVHDVHRAATSLLADAAAHPLTPAAELTELRDFPVAALPHHHQTEDSVLWPLLSATDPDVTAKLTDPSQEHDQLDAALNALAAAPVPDSGDRATPADAAVSVRDPVQSMVLAQLPEPVRDAIPAMSRRAHNTLNTLTLNTLQNAKAATA